MNKPQRANQYPDKSRVIKSVPNALWRYWVLVWLLMTLPTVINAGNFYVQFARSLVAGGVLFIAISAWSEWCYNKYGLKSVTWHNEIHLVDETKGADNDRTAMDKNISR